MGFTVQSVLTQNICVWVCIYVTCIHYEVFNVLCTHKKVSLNS